MCLWLTSLPPAASLLAFVSATLCDAQNQSPHPWFAQSSRGTSWKTVRQSGIYKDLNCPEHFNSKSRCSLSAVWLITYQDHNIPVSLSISLEQLPGKANYATHLTSPLIFSTHGNIILICVNIHSILNSHLLPYNICIIYIYNLRIK